MRGRGEGGWGEGGWDERGGGGPNDFEDGVGEALAEGLEGQVRLHLLDLPQLRQPEPAHRQYYAWPQEREEERAQRKACTPAGRPAGRET